jgi:hypothetical protein
MTTISLTQQIADEVAKLPPQDQERVLAFAQALGSTQPQGVPGATWSQFAGSISKEDLDLMEKAIEEECERVDPNEW